MKQSQQSLSGAYGAGLLCLHSLGGQVPPVFLEWAATKSISLLVRSMSLASKHVTHLQRRCYHTKISQRYFLSLPTELRGLKEADGLVVRSTSSDPYTNLSIENYLLTHSRPESRVYFFYINRPSVVIGRNQNPWLEANLQAFQSMGTSTTVELVRRRSGGGTVFHDHGNLNYCAIMPPKLFTRNLHAQVLANALNKESPLLRVRRFHVNERHDVVYDSCGTEVKVSGSAYKLVKGRALHHGTCLVGSDLTTIGQYLKSPTRSYISAKGVESTRTKVDNVIDWTKNDGADLKDGHGSNVSVSNLMERIISKFIKETARTIPGEENALKNMKILEIDGYARQPPKEQIVPTPFRLVYSADPPEVVDEIESGANELRVSLFPSTTT